MTHLRIHLSLVARFEGAEETVCASRNASALLNFAPHLVGNGLARSACHGFVGINRSG